MLSLIEAEGFDVYANQAAEEGLLRRVASDEVALFLWRNDRAVVCGRNQDVRAECRVDDLLAAGGRPARRLSGGGAVYHDLGNLNFSFVARAARYDVGRQLSVVREALSAFGLSARASGRNDLEVGGRKVSGNAFFRLGDRRLHHGTVLVSLDLAAAGRWLTPDAAKLARKGVASVAARVANVGELAPGATVEALSAAIVDAFGRVYGERVVRRTLDAAARADIAVRRARFASGRWLYRDLGRRRGDGMESVFTQEFQEGGARL